MRRFRSYHVAFSTLSVSVSSEAHFYRSFSPKVKPHSDTLSNSPEIFTESKQDTSINRGNIGLESELKEDETKQINHVSKKKSSQQPQKGSLPDCFGKDDSEMNMEGSIEMATQKLRIALQAWSVAEKAKTAATASMSKQSSLRRSPKLEGHTTGIPRILPINLEDLPEERSAEAVSMVTNVGAEDIVSGEAQVPEAMSDQKSQISSLPSDGWIRNKRSKFWEIVFSVPIPSANSNLVGTNTPFSASTPTKFLSQTNRSLTTKDVAITADSRQGERSAVNPSILSPERLGESRGSSNPVDSSNVATHQNIPPNLKRLEKGLQSSDTTSQSPPEVAHSADCTRPRLPYIHNQYKKNVALRLAALLNCDPRLGHVILERLSDDSLRLLLVMGTANEYYGKDFYDIVKQVKAADKDCDSAISAKEYEEWALNSWKHRRHHPADDTTTVDQHTASSREDLEPRSQLDVSTKGVDIPAASVQKNVPQNDSGYIPWPLYLRLLFNSSLPFMAFGILDNSTLIIASDAVDHSLSETLGLTSLAAAGVGGIISGVAGIQVHGLAERWTRITPPILTKSQCNSRSFERSTNIGNTIGIITGLVIGMLPLLFIRGDRDDQAEGNNQLRREAERIQKAKQKLQDEEHAQSKL
ncbi:unnamed protein product [Phytomonas sp. EM1]|nr:unnamed protein product [Phytomonas sp. EM1]|eukprot:CCW60244.1 unnamed protein product [Phytomonas sp. isolate EM1]